MATTSSPTWAARHNGIIGQADATVHASDINQLLGTHPDSEIYQGAQILTPDGTGGAFSSFPLNAWDKAQPFTMSGTTIGRVQLPVIAFNAGADLIVSLCNDNGGVPGTAITRTRVPASWFTTLSAYTAVPSTSPQALTATGSALAAPQVNTFTMGAVVNFSFTGGTPSGGGVGSAGPAVVTNGTDTIVILGGLNAANNYTTNVFTITYQGTNVLANMTAQPSLPTGLGEYAACTITTDPASGAQYVITTGGATGNSGSYTTVDTVYASQLTGATGQMSAWSTQTSLPQAMQTASAAASGNYVYVVGGVTPSNTILNTVYWATVSNGQLQSWNTGPALPVAVYDANVVASNGFLFVAGGFAGALLTNPVANVWYAPIGSDGSLGAWQAGPPLPAVNADPFGSAWTAGTDGLIFRGYSTQGLFSLPVSSAGPGPAWQRQSFPGGGPGALLGDGAGQYFWFEGFASGGTIYDSAGLILCPYLSVPLPASGLTNGATYHILLQQPPGTVDLNNYLNNVRDENVFPGNPLQLVRARGSGGSWAAQSSAIPLTIYDNSNNSATANGATGNDSVWHTWGDNGARISTLIRAATPDQRLIGLAEATVIPTQLNSNSGFETTLSPWAIGATGTLVRSNAQAYEGSWSAQVTPNGTSANVFFQSEHMPCVPGQKFTVSLWVYAANTITSNFSATLFWYDTSGTFISESDNLVTVPAGVWTPVSNTFAAPSGAYTFTINPRQSGTPPVGNIFYIDQVMAYDPYAGPQLASVAQITYPGSWPGSGLWPPTGLTELA